MSDNLNIQINPPPARPNLGRIREENQRYPQQGGGPDIAVSGQAIAAAGQSIKDKTEGVMADIHGQANEYLQNPEKREAVVSRSDLSS